MNPIRWQPRLPSCGGECRDLISAPAGSEHTAGLHPYPNGPDYLMIGMAVFLVAATFGVGLLYWRLHALPEHIAHKSQKVQFQIVCVLALLAMFTHTSSGSPACCSR